ncbi:hypothetical protein B0H66DRAFT_208612 [Apodospora peruviana]|uniref:RING-type domain-containing protein n=1 Tax=Apodospora peruviana TaxID=516989 RepID=A0AAE0M960_9PEZI|nr:hypothetical protein B0H66DRAFT_208612 [Apodospora peruviana]
MAASFSITEAQAELIKSLPQEDIPAKLRCAICSHLAIDTFRLPCCEQAICGGCQSKLPPSCPVCEHSPLSADDCKPHKNLRTTIKVFLRTVDRKRELNRPSDASPITPVDPSPFSSALPVTADLSGTGPGPQEAHSTETQQPTGPPTVEAPSAEPAQDAAGDQGNREVAGQPEPDASVAPAGDLAQTSQDTTEGTTEAEDGTALAPPQAGSEAAENAEAVNDEEKADGETQPDADATAAAGTGLGFGNNANGSFQGMGFGAGGFDQMQQMMMMQNGMAPNGFGSFPMMGMPGMNMDPMTMQMYMNGGFQGMGMNGMNTNMGMGVYGGEANNNWNNGQQSWNVGQDNFNHPSASGMGNGDYGSFNSGFQTGYNQGNYGHQNQFNDYRGRNQFGFRGRGRGRGYGYGYGQARGNLHQGYGFGGGNYQDQNFTGPQQYPNGMNAQMVNAQGGAVGYPEQESGEAKPDANVDEFGRVLRGENDRGPDDATQGEASQDAQHQAEGHFNPGDANNASREASAHPSANADKAFSAHGSNAGDANQTVPDVPLNAPKGPKAMMWGLPNTSFKHLQARGWVDTTKPSTPTSADGMGFPNPANDQHQRSPSRGSVEKDSERYHHDRRRSKDRGTERERDHERDHGRGRDQERDRRSRHERSYSRTSDDRKESSSHRRSRHHRSYSVTEEESDDEQHRHRKHDRKRRLHADDANESKSRGGGAREEVDKQRSRSASPVTAAADDSRRPSHRSSRKERSDRDSDKRRDRERDYEYESRGHKSSRRSHRDRDRDYDRSDRDRDREKDRSDRDRDRDRERDRDKDRDRDRKDRRSDRDRDRDRDRRDRDRGRERDREHRSHRSSKKTTDTLFSPVIDNENTGLDPKGGNRSLEIKGSAAVSQSQSQQRRRSSQASTAAAAALGGLDPHAAERAARDRERLLKETRRMASLAGSMAKMFPGAVGAKRRRDSADAEGGGDKEESERGSSRRKGRRGEIMVRINDDADEEERMRRLEAEREQARYD